MTEFLAKCEGIHFINLALGIAIFLMFLYHMLFDKKELPDDSAPKHG